MKIIIFILAALFIGCQKTPPRIELKDIPKEWIDLRKPENFEPKTYKGAQDCNPKKVIFKCISNVDDDTDKDIKRKMIKALEGYYKLIQDQNKN